MDPPFDMFLMGTNLDPVSALVLCIVSFFSSLITASMGVGGGMLMLAVMALIISPSALIPLHGAIQLGSNTGRLLLMRRHVMTHLLPAFAIGSLLGAFIGGQLVVALPVTLLKALLAAFIIYLVWVPKFKVIKQSNEIFFGLGAFSSFVTMFVGATGPLVAPFLAAASEVRQEVVATHAIFMTLQHLLKIVVFGVLGFTFQSWLPLLAMILVFGFAGTWVGKHVLNNMPEQLFRKGLKVVLTVIAVRILWDVLNAW